MANSTAAVDPKLACEYMLCAEQLNSLGVAARTGRSVDVINPNPRTLTPHPSTRLHQTIHHRSIHHRIMSTGNNPLSYSSQNIATYTQAISANTSNLLTELKRVNASAPAPATAADVATILQQLQTISEQLGKINGRLDVLEKSSSGSIDDTTFELPNDDGYELSVIYLPTAE